MWPWRVKSSDAVTSPLMVMDLPRLVSTRSPTIEPSALETGTGVAVGTSAGWTGGKSTGFGDPSRFHIVGIPPRSPRPRRPLLIELRLVLSDPLAAHRVEIMEW